MQSLYGVKNFDFVPLSFNYPKQSSQLKTEMKMAKHKHALWIMKPKASSQGKGITLIQSFEEVPHGQPVLVQQYIANPMLINGFKFDLRVYVALTSVNPLRLYVYEEGLCRFASEKYNTDDHKNVYSHLTNYSINKKNENH